VRARVCVRVLVFAKSMQGYACLFFCLLVPTHYLKNVDVA